MIPLALRGIHRAALSGSRIFTAPHAASKSYPICSLMPQSLSLSRNSSAAATKTVTHCQQKQEDHVNHWKIDRIVDVLLLPIIPVAFLTDNVYVNYALILCQTPPAMSEVVLVSSSMSYSARSSGDASSRSVRPPFAHAVFGRLCPYRRRSLTVVEIPNIHRRQLQPIEPFLHPPGRRDHFPQQHLLLLQDPQHPPHRRGRHRHRTEPTYHNLIRMGTFGDLHCQLHGRITQPQLPTVLTGQISGMRRTGLLPGTFLQERAIPLVVRQPWMKQATEHIQ
ncbi:hypothetical protein BV898_04370 [Hypsibius exemplaris]|uniref:Uncharacterized protein n=1 Tax=Hypsibius exemplaris TaxID=2072580 RepID=A0A1W0X2V3_HYPEX|nr:hypothetical protein BV898_04370 [Hypsibius exemplaris]